MQRNLLSVILRLHTTEGEAIRFLSNALLSLAGGTYAPLEALVVTQQFTPAQTEALETLLARFVWNDGCCARVVPFSSLVKKDHRSALLNAGIEAAQGRYIAILDYDDYVYEHAYATLINQLGRSSSAVAFGGCVFAHSIPTSHGYKVVRKSNPWQGKQEADFLRDNIFPIHTFVIDRDRLGDRLPRFNEKLTRVEDYEFLMRLRLETTFDLTCRDQTLCEYQLREDGTNTTMAVEEAETSANRAEWDASRTALEPARDRLKNHIEKEHLWKTTNS